MYKRVIILQQTDNSYALPNSQICGMVRLVGNSELATVTAYITNINSASYGSWWLVVKSSGRLYSSQLDTFNNFQCSMPIGNSLDIACVLVKIDNSAHIVAEGAYGSSVVDISSAEAWDSVQSTPYEQLLAATDNYYDDGIQAMHSSVSDKYKLVDSYSTAFERYYASGQTDSYYDSVRGDIMRLFVQFPPHYSLMKMFADSFFVRIDFRGTDQYFAMGVVQRQGAVRYICYALPAKDKKYQDKDFSYIEQDDQGYYILYQDAHNGQITTIL